MTLLDIRGISKSFRGSGGRTVTALDDVYLAAEQGTVAGLVGESGSGKTTVIRCLMGLEKPDKGLIEYDGMDMLHANRAARRRFQQEVQLVFQDPYSSLDPRMSVRALVEEGLLIHRTERSKDNRLDRVVQALEQVGLGPTDLDRMPRSFSGGQRQRIAIARALVMRPRLLVCDEPVSALDVSVQAQVINLLKRTQQELGLTVLFVAHDLAVVRHLCDRVSVLESGRLVEEGTRSQVFDHPRERYTRELLAAIPVPVPSPRHRPTSLAAAKEN